MDNIYDILNKFNSVTQDRPREQITESVMEVAIEEVGGEPMTAKQKSFAKLAPPADKITFADKIAGAKKEVDEMLGDVAAEAMKKAVVGLKGEQGMEEGNDFTGARLAAIKAGKPTFSVGGKTFKVTGDTSDEKMMEKKEKTLWPGTPEYKAKFGHEMKTGEKKRSSTGGEIEKTDTGVKHTKSYDDEEGDDAKTDDGAPKKRGRPKGKDKGPERVTAKAWKHKGGRVKEGMEDEESIAVVDRGEYDREGDMAKEQLHTAADAARELHDILDSDENLPEWVQSKITKAMDYLDTARDYMKASDSEDDEEQPMMAEKFASKAQARLMHATAGGADTGVSKKTAKEFIKKSHGQKVGDLPEKVKKDEAVEETTTSGAVATSDEAPKSKGKKGMVFGKGVYEGYEEKYKRLLTEGMSVNMSVGEDGKKSLNVNATDEDAVKLAQILKLAGMEQAHGCGSLEEADYANSPEETGADINTLVNTYSDGLDGQKTTGQTTIPVVAGQTQRMMSQVREQAEQRLWDLYKRYENK